MTTHKFQTEVNQLLHIIIHSLYSHKEIFLRELISNASDALDKLKYLTLIDEKFKDYDFNPRIDISFDREKATLTVSDTGIGMNERDLVENIGTIASSGTRKFVEQLTGDVKKDSSLIGQFGVGFYSSFMVADRIEVLSRKAGEEKAYRWVSDGKEGFEIAEAERESPGTTVLLHLNESGNEYANRWSIDRITKKYSNHIPFPIFLHYEDVRSEGEGENRKEIREQKVEQINDASALWKRPKSQLTKEDYLEFYKTISHDSEDPLFYVHTQAEGKLEYTTLFYVPKRAPLDLYFSDFRPGVKLYVKRVFITDEERELIPVYLRFIRGIIDSEDLPLNISREVLQKNRILTKIRSDSVKKLLGEFKKLSEDAEQYDEFYRAFGKQIKEGLYQDYENRDLLLELVRFKSTGVDGYTGLQEYFDRMKEDQKALYYITGDSEQNLRNSPLLEMYNERGIEVLIMDDEMDEIIIPAVGTYKDTELKSVNRSDAADELKTDEDKQEESAIEPLIARIREILKDRVKEVKASTRLSDSPSCIVADEKDPTVKMQGLLKSLGQEQFAQLKPILEINPKHPIVRRLQELEDRDTIERVSNLLFEQAMLLEGMKLENPSEFVKRLNIALEKSLE